VRKSYVLSVLDKSPAPYKATAESPLFIFAMDHRASFAKTLFGVTGPASAEELKRMRAAKTVVYEGAHQAAEQELPGGRAGLLVDEELGADVARRAKADGFVLAMPIERSGTKLFELEYGDEFPEHVEAFDPDYFKVLVRFNPGDDQSDKRTQITRLAEVTRWAEDTGRQWLFELLVPPTREQLSEYEDQDGFDAGARPQLTAEAIRSLRDGGVRPTIWKLEGYDSVEGAELVLHTVAADADHQAECIVLGRNAPVGKVEHWLEVAAPLPGFAGFAVGRTIWQSALEDLLAGRIERQEAVDVIAQRYRSMIDTYSNARLPESAVHRGGQPFTLEYARLTPDREERIRRALQGADMRGTKLPAWMAVALLAEVDALRSEVGRPGTERDR
jgi:myo-inositol catabolism protein IolC